MSRLGRRHESFGTTVRPPGWSRYLPGRLGRRHESFGTTAMSRVSGQP